jgi:hypothetical protein
MEEQLLTLIENSAEYLKYKDPIDSTQWAYNEGIQDLLIDIKNKIDK